MRRLLLGALPFAVLAAMLALRAWDPVPLQQLRWFAFDQYQRLAPRAYDPAMPVRIVDIDEASLARIGQWPWPRTQLAKLLERLTQAGAAAIAFDMVFAEPDRSSPDQVLKQWAPTLEVSTLRDSFALMPSHDSMLAAAIAQAPVVTGFALTREGAGSSRRAADPPASVDGIPRSLLASVLAKAPIDVEAGDSPSARAPTPKATFAIAGDDPALFVRAFNGAVSNLAELETPPWATARSTRRPTSTR
jgi:CHASE2 domain-containing sensor protein